jgi:hypothetical protein
MNAIPTTTNVTFNSESHELYFSTHCKLRKRSATDVVETTSLRRPPKALCMSVATPDRASPVAYQLHSKSPEMAFISCCSSDDVTINDQYSTLSQISQPLNMLTHSTFAALTTDLHDTDYIAIPRIINTITTINTGTNWVELQIEFLRTLKKLNKSIQRTDQSRLFFMRALHRHHRNHHCLNNTHSTQNDDDEWRFFTSPEWYKSQQDRHEFAKIVHHDCLYRTAF